MNTSWNPAKEFILFNPGADFLQTRSHGLSLVAQPLRRTSSKLVWATQQVEGQPEMFSETVSKSEEGVGGSLEVVLCGETAYLV